MGGRQRLPIAADPKRFDEAFAIVIWWERQNKKRLPYLPLPHLNGRASFRGDEWLWNDFLSTTRLYLNRNPGLSARTRVNRNREVREDLARAAGMSYTDFMKIVRFLEKNRRKREAYENSPKVIMWREQYARSQNAALEICIFKRLARGEYFPPLNMEAPYGYLSGISRKI